MSLQPNYNKIRFSATTSNSMGLFTFLSKTSLVAGPQSTSALSPLIDCNLLTASTVSEYDNS